MSTPKAKPPEDRVKPVPLDTAADRDGKTVEVGPDEKKRQLELQGELEHTDGPKRVEIQREVRENDKAGKSGSGTSVRKGPGKP